jgi:Flp pilus assembly pilin Flp
MTEQNLSIGSVPEICSLHHLLVDETGQDLIEYALIMTVMGLGAVSALKGVTNQISSVFSTVTSDLTSAL